MKQNKNKGFSLVELIVVIAIMAVLVGILAPQFIKYVEKSRQAKVKQEADAFYQAAQVSIVDWGTTADASFVPEKFKGPNGTKYGRVTNWSLINADKSDNGELTKIMMSNLNISKNVEISAIPMSSTVPESNGKGTSMSMGEEAIFQLLYDSDLNIIMEYNRNGYFVRIDGNETTCVKLENSNDSQFTKLKM